MSVARQRGAKETHLGTLVDGCVAVQRLDARLGLRYGGHRAFPVPIVVGGHARVRGETVPLLSVTALGLLKRLAALAAAGSLAEGAGGPGVGRVEMRCDGR